MNLAEHEGDGKAKAKEKIKYADYHEIEAIFVTTGQFYGGQPGDCQSMQKLVKKIREVCASLNYDIVIPNGVIYASAECDKTSEVIKALNKNYAAASVKTPGVKVG